MSTGCSVTAECHVTAITGVTASCDTDNDCFVDCLKCCCRAVAEMCDVDVALSETASSGLAALLCFCCCFDEASFVWCDQPAMFLMLPLFL